MLDRLFHLTRNRTTFRTEILAGVSSFLTLAYIIAVNPAILADAGIPFAGAFIATILASAIGCAIMGLWAGWPVAVAPGMGLNAFFAYIVVLGMGYSWQQGLAAVFVASVLFFLFSITRMRVWLIQSIPAALQIGITAGIGLFLAMIGLTSAGIIVDNPDTLVALGDASRAEFWLALAGLVLMAGLAVRGINGGILLAILIIAALGWIGGLAEFNGLTAAPPVASAAFQLDFSVLLEPGFLSVVFVMFFVDFFDTTGTLTAIAGPAGKRRADGQIDTLDRAVLADTSASIFGSLLGTSNMTSYLESAAGIRAGGRSGLTAVVVGILFLACLFFEPLFASIPAFATAPALIFVAAAFLTGLKEVHWPDMAEAIPVLVMMLIMPLSFSIAAGIAFGFFTWIGIRLVTGRAGEVTAGIWAIALFALLWLVLSL
jgi:AGZA family xanthine/uracil permease-like MFS transporter